MKLLKKITGKEILLEFFLVMTSNNLCIINNSLNFKDTIIFWFTNLYSIKKNFKKNSIKNYFLEIKTNKIQQLLAKTKSPNYKAKGKKQRSLILRVHRQHNREKEINIIF